MKMICTLDYVTTTSVNDSVKLLQDVIEKCVLSSNKKDSKSLLTSILFSLKHESEKSLNKNDNICYHRIQYALCRSE